MPEVWQPIPGFDGYEASNQGRIRSPRQVLNPWRVERYLRVEIQRKPRSVHRLVAMAFHGEPEGPLQALHRDDDPLNNTPENLYWGDHSQNMQDRVTNGTALIGERNGAAKLNANQVREIRERLAKGESQRSLAKAYGVSRALIYCILNRKAWPHLA